jgi:hypothetical protein
MITSTGRDILAKYLIGQTSSFASHIAIGCGPLPSVDSADYRNKTELDFEMDRYPIISRSFSSEKITIPFSSVSSDGDATFTFTVQDGGNNQFVTGQTIAVSGCPSFSVGSSPSTANGTYIITNATSTTITVDNPSPGNVDLQTVSPTPSATISIAAYVPQIVFTAELPLSERYEITELGLYPSYSNQYSNGLDSRTVTNLTTAESWKYFTNSSATYSDIPYYSTITDATNSITVTDKAFQTNSDNPFFIIERVSRQERPRFLKDVTIINGNMSEFDSNLNPSSTADYIQLNNFGLDLSKNNPETDTLKIAFSLINAVSAPSQIPKSLNIMLQFISANGNESAKYHFRQTNGTTLASSNRYQVLSMTLNAATFSSRTTNFSWENVSTLRIYAGIESAVDYSDTPPLITEYAIALDAIRFENKSNTNPLYGLVGYTLVKTDEEPLVKSSGTNNLVEFRLFVGVSGNV